MPEGPFSQIRAHLLLFGAAYNNFFLTLIPPIFYCPENVICLLCLVHIFRCTLETVADPEPLMLGVLDRWTPSQYNTDTNSANQFTYRTMSHRSKRLNLANTAPLSCWPFGFREGFSFYFV